MHVNAGRVSVSGGGDVSVSGGLGLLAGTVSDAENEKYDDDNRVNYHKFFHDFFLLPFLASDILDFTFLAVTVTHKPLSAFVCDCNCQRL
jgi:hypothetical protein